MRQRVAGSPQSLVPLLLLLLLTLCSSSRLSGQVAWNKQGGVCFRVEDNQPLGRLFDFDSLFTKYGFTFSMSLQSEQLAADPGYAAWIKALLAKGHEFMDFTPSHQTNFFTVANPEDTLPYHGHPAVDHIRLTRVCLKWGAMDTTVIRGEGKINVTGDQVISVNPGEFRDLYGPVYIPNLYIPATGKIYTWKNLQNSDTLNPDTLQLMSFWEEDVNPGTLSKVPYHKLSSYDATMSSAARKLLGQRTLDICANGNIPRPYTWIQPYGPFPMFTAADVAGSMGATLGYTAGTTYREDALKCYNEFNPSGYKQFEITTGDFRTPVHTFEQNRSLIAGHIAKHKVAFDQNYFNVPEGQWTSYLKKVDSLLAWLSESGIPVMTQQQWAAALYDSISNPLVNVFPLLQTDLDGDDTPDGYLLQDAVLITNDGVSQSDGRSLEIAKLGSMCFIGDLGGLEKGINKFWIYTRGDSANVVNVVFWFTETGESVAFDFKSGSPAWTMHAGSFYVPDSVSVVDVDIYCQPFYGGYVRISGMTLNGIPRPHIHETPLKVMTNRQFGSLHLDTVITDPIYSLKNLQVQISGGNLIHYHLDMTEQTLEVWKPHSFWLGRDSLFIRAANPEGGADSAWLRFETLPVQICHGMTITLTALDTLPGLTWQWESLPFDSTLTHPQSPQTEITPPVTTHYTLTASGPGGFYHQDTLTVWVRESAAVTLSGLLPAYCANAPPVQLYGSPPGGVFSGKAVVGDYFYPKYATTGLNSVYYTATSPNGCTGTDSATVTIIPLPKLFLPPDTLVCHWQTVLLDAGSGYDTYLWSTGETTPTVAVNLSGAGPDSTKVISLIVTANGCPAFDTTVVGFKSCTGTGSRIPDAGCVLTYPNPASGYLTVENLCSSGPIRGFILDLFGNEVFTGAITTGRNIWNIGNLPSGVYIMWIKGNEISVIWKFVKIQ